MRSGLIAAESVFERSAKVLRSNAWISLMFERANLLASASASFSKRQP